MTIRTTHFDGTDWTDGEVLDAADLNNTIEQVGVQKIGKDETKTTAGASGTMTITTSNWNNDDMGEVIAVFSEANNASLTLTCTLTINGSDYGLVSPVLDNNASGNSGTATWRFVRLDDSDNTVLHNDAFLQQQRSTTMKGYHSPGAVLGTDVLSNLTAVKVSYSGSSAILHSVRVLRYR